MDATPPPPTGQRENNRFWILCLSFFPSTLKYKVGAQKIRLRMPYFATLVALFILVNVATEHMLHRKGFYSLEAVQHNLIII